MSDDPAPPPKPKRPHRKSGKPYSSRKRTHKQRLFVHQFLAGPKGTRGDLRKAALAVGYRDTPFLSKAIADMASSRIVQEELKRHWTRFDLTDERIVAEYCRLAFANIGNVFKTDPATGELFLDDPDQLSDDVTAAISEIKPVVDPATGRVRYAVKLHDKKGALDFLAKMRGLIRTPDINVTLIQLMANLNLALYTTDELRLLSSMLRRGMPYVPPPKPLGPGEIQVVGESERFNPRSQPYTNGYGSNGTHEGSAPEGG